MKIAHFSWEYPPVIFGGLGTFATEITQKQKKFGNDITVFTLNGGNKLETYENMDGIDVYRPKTLNTSDLFRLFASYELKSWGDNFGFFADVVNYNYMSASQLVNQLIRKDGKNFDLIDAHDWLGILGGMVVKKELDVPLVFHVHSTEVGRSVGRGSHAIKDIEFEGGQQADCVITVSHAMADELQKLGFPPDKIRVCWNGVDPTKYDPDKIPDEEKLQLRHNYGISDDENMLFFVGRLVTVKGVDNLVRCMPSVLQEFPNTKLVVLGIGDMEWPLRDMAQNMGIGDKIIFRNEFISESERIKHYAASDCVVLPSIYEPFGIVCTESMSMAKPTVVGASGTNGFREQIIPDGDEKCGIHVNGLQPNDISWGIKQVLQEDDKGVWMGEKARERVLETFTWDAIAKKTLDIYEEFLR